MQNDLKELYIWATISESMELAEIQSGFTYYFCDGHATDNLTSFYDSSKVQELTSIVDWNAVKAPFWGGQENLNVKRKKQAEFLLRDDLDPQWIFGYVCYNEFARQQLISIGVPASKIKIFPSAYF